MYRFDDNIFKKLIEKIIIGDFDENGNYDTNVIKFILKINNTCSSKPKNFLSLGCDERL